MAIEDTIAEELKTPIDGLGLFSGSVSAERVHFPSTNREDWETPQMFVFSSGVNNEGLVNRQGKVKQDVLISVLVGQAVGRLVVSEQQAIVDAGVAIEAAIVGEFSGFQWISGLRRRFDESWLEFGVYASHVLATYRNPAATLGV